MRRLRTLNIKLVATTAASGNGTTAIRGWIAVGGTWDFNSLSNHLANLNLDLLLNRLWNHHCVALSVLLRNTAEGRDLVLF